MNKNNENMLQIRLKPSRWDKGDSAKHPENHRSSGNRTPEMARGEITKQAVPNTLESRLSKLLIHNLERVNKEQELLKKSEGLPTPHEIWNKITKRYEWGDENGNLIHKEEKNITTGAVIHKFTVLVRVKGQNPKNRCYEFDIYPQTGELDCINGNRETDKGISGPEGTSALHLSEIEFCCLELVLAQAKEKNIFIHDHTITKISARNVIHEKTLCELKPYIPETDTVTYKKNSPNEKERLGYDTACSGTFGKSAFMLLKHLMHNYGLKFITSVEIDEESMFYDDEFDEKPSRSVIEIVGFNVADAHNQKAP